jgi:CBS domain-containing membrane protein
LNKNKKRSRGTVSMMPQLFSILRGRSPIPMRDAVRASCGALLGIAFTGLIARLIADATWSLTPLLVAPLGASAVLAFAIPASPLAQPRAIIGGNVLSAVVGTVCALLIPQPALAASLAVGAAILMMILLGCLHPPGGAIALGAVLMTGTGPAPTYIYALTVLLCSALLVLTAIIYARLTRVAYPQSLAPPKVHATQDPPPQERVGYTPADLDAALVEYGKLLDVSREDLDALFRQVELKAHRRLHAQIRCSDIMSRDIVSVHCSQPADEALEILHKHDLRTAPVLDSDRRVIGLVRRAELLRAQSQNVSTVLDPNVRKVSPDTPIEALLPHLSSGFAHEVMVVDADGVLVGMVTQTDLLAVLYRAHIVESLAA